MLSRGNRTFPRTAEDVWPTLLSGLQRDELVRRVQKSRCDAQQYARMMGAYMILVVSKGQRGLFPKSVPRM